MTASGTEVGKTFVTAGICRNLLDGGLTVRALKPVISGFDPKGANETDTGVLLAAQGLNASPENIAAVSPWRFAAPLSPDMAAAREGREIDFERLLGFCRTAWDGPEDVLLVEGIGGILVPLDGVHTVMDWVVALRMPLLVVGGSYLGTISHTLAALEALRARNLVIAAVVISESEESPVPLEETVSAIQRFSSGTIVHSLPRDCRDDNFSALADLVR